MPKNLGSKGQLTGDVVGGSKVEPPTRDCAPTLADIGIDKKVSMRAQRLAALPAEKFEQVSLPLRHPLANVLDPPRGASGREFDRARKLACCDLPPQRRR